MIDKGLLLKDIEIIKELLNEEGDIMGSVTLMSLATNVLEGHYDIKDAKND